VVLDCKGFNVTNNGTGGLTGGIIAIGNYANITIENCPSVSSYQYGVGLDEADNSIVRNVTAHDNGDAGIYIARSGNDNLIINNTAYGHPAGSFAEAGFYMFSGSDNSFVNNIAYDNDLGFDIRTGAINTNLTNNTAYDSLRGVDIADSGQTIIDGDHYYDNAYDLYFTRTSGTKVLNLINVIFDNPSGTFQNFTNLSLNHTASVTGSYSINWTTNSTALPANTTSFDEKFVDITAISGTVSLDAIVWHYTDAEVVNGNYNESSFQVWKHNGSWSDTSATLDTNANTLRLTSHSPASIYGILANLSAFTNVTLYGANITNKTVHPRYNGTAPGNISTEGGNLTNFNISALQLSERWAAYYGNVSGDIILGDTPGSDYVYQWSWNSSAGGVVCLSTNGSMSDLSAQGAQGSDIDTAWSLSSSASDSGANTFTGSNCTVGIGAANVIGAASADTGQAGGFKTCALSTKQVPVKDEMLFCTSIISGGSIWNGGTGDFEVMVPTPQVAGSTETYYFYANLD
jgi:parallel beta-helix repeat protein